MHRQLRWVAAICLVTLAASATRAEPDPAARPAPVNQGFSDQAAAPSGLLGCLARSGDVVVESQLADTRFVPASVHKLAVTVAALHWLGPAYRTRTRLRATGGIANGTLTGDLVVEAAGDPTWSHRFFERGAAEPLDRIALSLVATGLLKVTGDLVVDLSRFPGRPTPPTRALNEMAFGFGAPTSALAIDENFTELHMEPARRVGEPPILRGEDLEIVNLATTASKARDQRGTIDFQAEWATGRLVVRGEYPISEPPYDIEIAVDDGDRRAAELLRHRLEAAGLEIEGQVRLSPQRVEGTRLAELVSPPLAEWLPPILAESSNWHAEMLLRVLAADQLGEGRSEDGRDLVKHFLEDTVGIAKESVQLDDASGISPYDLWTPRAAVQLLDWAYQQSWRDTFLAALARPGRGTLEHWPALPPNVAAKTGTQKNTIALAGYLLAKAPNPPIVFACFQNHNLEPRPTQRRELASRLQAWSRR